MILELPLTELLSTGFLVGAIVGLLAYMDAADDEDDR